MAPELSLGLLLRYAGETDATIWVGTDGAYEVEGHHYALVRLTALEPGTTYEHEVYLDGAKVWPDDESDFPAFCDQDDRARWKVKPCV